MIDPDITDAIVERVMDQLEAEGRTCPISEERVGTVAIILGGGGMSAERIYASLLYIVDQAEADALTTGEKHLHLV